MNSLQMYCRLRGTIPHLVGSTFVQVATRPCASLAMVAPSAAGRTPSSTNGGFCHRHQLQIGIRLCSAAASSSNALEQSPAPQQDMGHNIPVTTDERGSSGDGSKTGMVKRWRNPVGGLLWPFRSSNDLRLTAPPLQFPNRLGDSLAHMSDSLSRVLRGLSPWRLFRRAKDDDDENHYRLKLDVPGLGKEDVKVTVEDGVLVVRGERRQDEYWSDDDDGEWWYGGSYGRYDASLVLPEDAKVDGIKAEVRNGVLYVTVPREGGKKVKNVKEVEVI